MVCKSCFQNHKFLPNPKCLVKYLLKHISRGLSIVIAAIGLICGVEQLVSTVRFFHVVAVFEGTPHGREAVKRSGTMWSAFRLRSFRVIPSVAVVLCCVSIRMLMVSWPNSKEEVGGKAAP
jgi:hypothetical protein